MSQLRSPLLVDLLAALLADAQADVLARNGLGHGADAGRLSAGRADEHHVRDRQRRRKVDDAARDHRAADARGVLDRTRAAMLLDHVDVLDENLAVLRQRLDDTTLLAGVLAAEDVYTVALLDLHGLGHLENLRCERDDLHEVL